MVIIIMCKSPKNKVTGYSCPIIACTKKCNTRRDFRDHLTRDHLATELKQISNQQYLAMELFGCTHCCKKIYLNQGSLDNHNISFCSETRDNEGTGNNISKAMNTFQIDTPNEKAWETTLQFFTADELVIKPVPIRRAIFDKLNPRVKVQFFDLYQKVMTLASTVQLTSAESQHEDWRIMATPFLAMSFLLPAMILAPLPKDRPKEESIASVIHKRIIRFQQGEGKQLLEEVHVTKCWTPLEKRQRAETEGANVTKAAQGAADSGHLGGCMKQVLNNAFPPVLFTPEALETMQMFFPAKPLGGHEHKTKPLSSGSSGRTPKFRLL